MSSTVLGELSVWNEQSSDFLSCTCTRVILRSDYRKCITAAEVDQQIVGDTDLIEIATDEKIEDVAPVNSCGVCFLCTNVFRWIKKKLTSNMENDTEPLVNEEKSSSIVENDLASHVTLKSESSAPIVKSCDSSSDLSESDESEPGLDDSNKNSIREMGYVFKSFPPPFTTTLRYYNRKQMRNRNRNLILQKNWTNPSSHLYVPMPVSDESTAHLTVSNSDQYTAVTDPDATKNQMTRYQLSNIGNAVVDIGSTADENFKNDINQTEFGFQPDFSSQQSSNKRKSVSQVKTGKRSKRRNSVQKPQEMRANVKLNKYWKHRYSLFSKFDEGIKLDEESWFSVTPEKISKHIAKRCQCDLIVDGFCGAGGNTIQFAFTCERVIAIDIDPRKIAMARVNARVYGVEDRIEFVVGDYFQIAPSLRGVDVVFLSPPWGGPAYSRRRTFHLDRIMQPYGGVRIFQVAKGLTDHIAYYLPKNVNITEAIMLDPDNPVEVEQQLLDSRLKAITAYYGSLHRES